MLSELTAAKIDHGLASLALAQARGEAPPAGQVSLSELARRCGVSEATMRRYERVILSKAAASLLSDPDLPAHLRRRAATLLSQ